MYGSLTARLASFTGRVALGTLLFGALGAALHGAYDRLLAAIAGGLLGVVERGGTTVLTVVSGGIRVQPVDPALSPFVYSTLDPHLSAPLFVAILMALAGRRGLGAWLTRLLGGFGFLLAVHVAALVTEVEFRPLVAVGYRMPTYYVYRFAWWVVCVWSILLLPAVAALYVYVVDWAAPGRPSPPLGWRRPAAALGIGAVVLLAYTAGMAWMRPGHGAIPANPAAGDDGLETLSGGASPADAVAAFRAGRFEEAASRFREILARDPLNQAARHSLGVALYREGRLEDARRELEAVARARPDLPGLAVSLGAVLYDLGNIDEAVASFHEADLSSVTDPALLLEIGGALFAAGDPEGADRAYRRLQAVEPGNPVVDYNLGNVAMARGRDDEAIRWFEAAARRNPTAEVHNNLGVLYARTGRPADAEQAYLACLRIAPDNVPAAFNLGRLLAGGERRCEAIPYFERCAEDGDGSVAARCRQLAAQLAPACGDRSR